jgi:hypothetical protein
MVPDVGEALAERRQRLALIGRDWRTLILERDQLRPDAREILERRVPAASMV